MRISLDNKHEKNLNFLISVLAISMCLSIAVTNVFLAFTIILTLFLIITKKGIVGTLQHYKGYIKVIALFALTMLLSALFSSDVPVGLKRFADMYIYRLFPFFLVLLLQPFLKMKNILACLFLSFFLVSLYVFWQGYLGDWQERVAGLFGHPMTYAGFCCLFLPILAVMISEQRLQLTRNYKFFLFVCFFLGLVGLLLNQTRGAWLAVFLAILIISFIYLPSAKMKTIMILLTIFCIAGAMFLQVPVLKGRLESITDTQMQSNTERILLWESSLKMFQDNKLLGVGLGQYSKTYNDMSLDYKSTEAKEILEHAHNNFLHMLAENGIVGFIGFVYMFGYFLWQSLKGWRHKRNPYDLMIISMLLAFLFQGFTEYNFGNSALMKTFWLLFGLLLFLETDWDSRSRVSDTKI